MALRAIDQGERSITREPEKAAIEWRGQKEDFKKFPDTYEVFYRIVEH